MKALLQQRKLVLEVIKEDEKTKIP